MSDEDYDQGFAEGYYQGLSTDKETSFLILAARIDELKKENEKLRAATLEAAANVADVKARTVGNGRDEYSLACRHIARELRAAATAIRETEECSTSST